MPYRQQFRTYAEWCLRAAELSESPEQKASLIATANAWHRLAQELELRDGLSARLPPINQVALDLELLPLLLTALQLALPAGMSLIIAFNFG